MVNNSVLNKRSCYFLIQNQKYIATIGHSVTVYRKEDLTPVHLFKMRINPREAWFWDEETILISTTAQDLLLLSIEKQERICSFKAVKGREYGISGRFVPDKYRNTIYGIIPGRGLCGGYVATIHPRGEWSDVVSLPKELQSMCALANVNLDHSNGTVTFFHYGSAGNDRAFSRIWSGSPPFSTPFECVWSECIPAESPDMIRYDYHDETYILGLRGEKNAGKSRLCVCTNWHTGEQREFLLSAYFKDHNAYNIRLTHRNKYLLVYNHSVILVIDFTTGEHIAQYTGEYLACCEIIEDKVIIGTWQKTLVYPFPYWMEWKEKPKAPDRMPDWRRI